MIYISAHATRSMLDNVRFEQAQARAGVIGIPDDWFLGAIAKTLDRSRSSPEPMSKGEAAELAVYGWLTRRLPAAP